MRPRVSAFPPPPPLREAVCPPDVPPDPVIDPLRAQARGRSAEAQARRAMIRQSRQLGLTGEAALTWITARRHVRKQRQSRARLRLRLAALEGAHHG